MKGSYPAKESGSVTVERGIFEAPRRLHAAPDALLAHDVADIVGADRSRARLGDGVGNCCEPGPLRRRLAERSNLQRRVRRCSQ